MLDTGVAYANRGKYRRSPDFNRYSFVQGYDFIDRTPYANDHNGHGTFVAGTIAEATDNHYGLTGLAYDARIMPVRVLDSAGEGDASVIAEGVRFAVRHGARIINLSLEFSSDVGASDIPELIDALALRLPPRGTGGGRGGQRGEQHDSLSGARQARDRSGARRPNTDASRATPTRVAASRWWPPEGDPTRASPATRTATRNFPRGGTSTR